MELPRQNWPTATRHRNIACEWSAPGMEKCGLAEYLERE